MMRGFLLRMLFGEMKDKEIKTQRFFNSFDPAKNRTVIVVSGRLSSKRLAGALCVLDGTHDVRRRPGKGGEA